MHISAHGKETGPPGGTPPPEQKETQMYTHAKHWTVVAALTGVIALAGCTTRNAVRPTSVSNDGTQDIRIVADTLPEIVVTARRLAPIPDAESVVPARRLPAALQEVPEVVVVASRLPAEDGPMTAGLRTVSLRSESGEGAPLQ